MEDLPRGAVTFLFTDIEGSTRLWQELPGEMPGAYARHDAIVKEAMARHGGLVYKTIGDAFQVAFPTAIQAIGAASDAQVALQAEPWPLSVPLLVRMAIHTGVVEPGSDGDYRSPTLNRLGRLIGVGHGSQVLVSQATYAEAKRQLPPGVTLVDLGARQLKDLGLPEHVYQLGAPDLLKVFPELRTLDVRPHNLPTQLTRFIGRGDDLAAVRDLMGWPDIRHVTLTGPGGIGKTRLALQAGAEMLDWFDDGVFFVRLEALTDLSQVVPAIVQALRLEERGGADPASILTDYLRDKHLLLILDNLEQVIESAARIGDLLTACPRLHVLATSRSRLQLRGEHEYPLTPLRLPDMGGDQSIEALSRSDSMYLFVDRAQAAHPSFTLTGNNASTVAEICLRLDGIPLAIELAAARVRMLPPEAMLKRLATRLPLLTGGARDLPARQQTLRQTIDWSYALLDEPAKALFRRLSVFAGGATLEAIEAVAIDTEDGWDALAVLESLVDHSLLRQTELEGDPRFAMFETIREFGIERLDAEGETDEARQRHAAYFAGYPALAYTGPTAEDAIRQLELVEIERDNLRVARDWTLEHDVNLACQLVDTKAIIWNWRVPTREEVTWTRAVVASDAPGVEEVLRARCQTMYAYLVYWYPDDQEGLEHALGTAREALETFESRDVQVWVLRALIVSSNLELAMERLAGAIAYIERAVDVARLVGNPTGLFSALSNAGFLAHQSGDFSRSRELYNEALVMARAWPDRPDCIAGTLNGLGELSLAEGDLAAAGLSFQEALTFCIYQRQPVALMMSMLGLAIVAARSGQWRRTVWLGGAIEKFQTTQEFGIATEMKPMVAAHEEHMAAAHGYLPAEVILELMRAGAAATLETIMARMPEPEDDSATVLYTDEVMAHQQPSYPPGREAAS